MEVTVKAKFITDFYGSSPALGAQEIMKRYLEERVDKAFLSFMQAIEKKAANIPDKAAEILSVFHRDEKGNPVLGPWMLHRCLVTTGETIFNKMENRNHPKRDIIGAAIINVEPLPFIELFDGKGKRITRPDGVRTYTCSPAKKNRSFFKAYEWIGAGATFEYRVLFDEAMLAMEFMRQIIEKSGRFGVGSFRQRYGKFDVMAHSLPKETPKESPKKAA